ncbi:MAG: DUF5074 domain-containing protein [Salinimicrobium sp.]
MNFQRLLQLLFFAAVFTSCSSDDPVDPNADEAYYDGVFVLNEGNFGSGNATVSFVENGTNEVSHRIFKNANSGANLGDTAQDLALNEQLAFVVLNASNKIEVVNRYTFETVATISEGLENPRKIAFLDGKAYVSNWGDGTDPADDFVAVYNAETFELEQQIPVAEGPDAIAAEGSKIYVAHSGGWSFNNIVSVIDSEAAEVGQTIEVGDVPVSLVLENGNLWVLSSGLPDYAEAGESLGSLSKINLASLQEEQELEIQGHPANLKADNGSLYYTLDNGVYVFIPSEEKLPEMPFLELNDVRVLYGFNVFNSKVYAASANLDFTGNGRLFIYDLANSNTVTSFQTGINPNGIFLNE